MFWHRGHLTVKLPVGTFDSSICSETEQLSHLIIIGSWSVVVGRCSAVSLYLCIVMISLLNSSILFTIHCYSIISSTEVVDGVARAGIGSPEMLATLGLPSL